MFPGFRSALFKHATRPLPSPTGSLSQILCLSGRWQPNVPRNIWQQHIRVGAPKCEQFTLLDLTGPQDLPTTSSSSRFSITPAQDNVKCRRLTSSLTTWLTARGRKTLQQQLLCLTLLSGLLSVDSEENWGNFWISALSRELLMTIQRCWRWPRTCEHWRPLWTLQLHCRELVKKKIFCLQLRSWNWFILILYPYLLIFKIVLVFIINILR